MILEKIKLPRINADYINSTTILFLLLAPIVIFNYISYVFNPVNASNYFLYILQIIADIISIGIMSGLWFTIFLDVFVLSHHRLLKARQQLFWKENPTIDILITCAGEPLSVIKKTVEASLKIDYPHQVFILDDGKSSAVAKLAEELKVNYIARPNRKYAKAGNINYGLQFSKAQFFAILDADQVPTKNFITKLLPFMDDETVAMVQAPQVFINTQNFISSGTSQAQEIFYKYLCPAKNISNSVFCVGTNVIFRRSSIDKINGITQIGHSEDIWTSRLLHQEGFKTVFVNQVVANGQAPSKISSYFRQQLRWATGGMGMLFLDNPLLDFSLSIDQKLQYFMANIFYLVGFSILIYVLMPIAYLLFGISALTDSNLSWFAYCLPYFLLYYSLTGLLLGRIKLSTMATALASFYPYILAFFSVVFNTTASWQPTTSTQARKGVIMHWIWPHVLLILLSLLSLIVGWFDYQKLSNTLINTVWVLWNSYLLISFLVGDSKKNLKAKLINENKN